MALPDDYPTWILGLRRRLGLTQAQLADRVGAAYVSVNRWENRQTRPTALAWRRLLELEAQAAPRLAEAPASYRADPTGQVASEAERARRDSHHRGAELLRRLHEARELAGTDSSVVIPEEMLAEARQIVRVLTELLRQVPDRDG